MPGYNNGNWNNNTWNGWNNGNWNGVGNTWAPNGSNSWGANGYNQQSINYQQGSQQENHYQYFDYVSGRAAAEAYQLPPNVNKAILYDNDQNRFYIKEYDNTGRPRVVADNDFQAHVEPEPQPQTSNIDLTPYATKDDIRQMINEAISSISLPNFGDYVTRKEFDSGLKHLSVGNGGRIVRTNESNA